MEEPWLKKKLKLLDRQYLKKLKISLKETKEKER